MDSTTIDLKWEARQRLTFIEATLVWSGEISTRDLTHAFGIGRAQASKDLAVYQAHWPKNIAYDRSRKRYVPTKEFSAGLVTGNPDEFLRFARNAVSGQQGTVILPFPSVVVLDIPAPPVDVRNLQALNRAIRHQAAVTITYRSMSGKPEATYTLSPHTLVHNGFRWHVRGFSAEHGEFRDFVLSRITAVPAESSVEYTPDDGDRDWHEVIALELIPHPDLNERQREVIETDYGMTGGVLRIEQRTALLPYLARLMRIPTGTETLNPRAHPVIVRNRESVAARLEFGGE